MGSTVLYVSRNVHSMLDPRHPHGNPIYDEVDGCQEVVVMERPRYKTAIRAEAVGGSHYDAGWLYRERDCPSMPRDDIRVGNKRALIAVRSLIQPVVRKWICLHKGTNARLVEALCHIAHDLICYTPVEAALRNLFQMQAGKSARNVRPLHILVANHKKMSAYEVDNEHFLRGDSGDELNRSLASLL